MNAICPKCGETTFRITDEFVQCAYCGLNFGFNWIVPGVVCETLATDLVMLINEGK